jgi:predicted PurR-regulated permease PerM
VRCCFAFRRARRNAVGPVFIGSPTCSEHSWLCGTADALQDPAVNHPTGMRSGSFSRVMVVGLLLAAFIYIAYAVRQALLLIFVSIILAVVFAPWISWVQHWRLGRWSPSRGAAILIVVAIIVAGVVLFLTLAVPPIARDANQMIQDVPEDLHSVRQKFSHLPFGDLIASRLNEGTVQRWIQAGVQHAFAFVQRMMGSLLGLLSVVLLTAYFLLDGHRAFNWAISLFPGNKRDRLARTLQHGATRMQGWLHGQVLLMLILASSSALVFGLLKVRYFYAIAVFAGLANFVPILGPILTVILAGIIAALDSWTKLLGVLIFYAVYQQVENAYLTPQIMRATVDLPGISVIVALTIGGELAGLMGAIVAVPTAALIATFVDELIIRSPHRQRGTITDLGNPD